jgi:DNA-binding response OmpR family regulator
MRRRCGNTAREVLEMRLLVVEDDEPLRRFLRIVLARHHDVVCVGDGREALRQLALNAPDVLLSDLNLPDLSGEDIARSAAGSKPPPAILLCSGDHARLDRARPLAAAILPKPFSMAELARVLESLAPEGTRQAEPPPKQDESRAMASPAARARPRAVPRPSRA